MRVFILVFIGFVSFTGLTQEDVVSTENHLKLSDSKIQRTFASVNESNDDFSVYLQDADSVYGYLFNGNYEKTGELTAEALRNKYKTFLGSTAEKSVHSTYFSNNKSTKFSVQNFDFENKKAETKEIDLTLDNEKFLQSFTNNNIFYILSIGENQSVFNLYVFNKESYERHVIDLSEITFINWLKRETSLYNILDRESVFAKIENDIPNSILSSFNRSKLYLNENKIFITLDQNFAKTEIITINLEDFSHNYDTVNQNQEDDLQLKFKRSNSFLVDNKLFQVSIIKYQFVFSIKDLETKEILKEYTFNKDDVLTLENSNFILDKTEKKRTNKFLKRATNDIVGLNIQKRNSNFEIEFGSCQLESEIDMTAIIFSNIAGVGGFLFSNSGEIIFSPGQPSFGFSSYLSNNTISSNTVLGVLDNNLEFTTNEIAENVFDKIETFSEQKSKFINAENIFLYKGNMFFCATIKDSKNFLIAKFDN